MLAEIHYSQVFSLGSEFELGIFEFGELATAANDIVHPTSDGLGAEVCVLVANEATTFGLVSHKMVFSRIELLMEGRFLVFVYPD